MRRLASVPLGVVVLLQVLSPPASGWQILAHYQITVDAGADPAVALLPDSWPSHGGITTLWEITEWFAWSHGVQRTGRTTGVPNVPVYLVADDNAPGVLMYRSYRQRFAGSREAYGTSLGFLVHNAQDRAVHWRYFRGGARASWKEEHEYKEYWADCWIFRIKMRGQFKQGAPGNLPQIGNQGHADVVREAQRAARSNGISVDRGTTTLVSMEDKSGIEERFADGGSEIQRYLQTEFTENLCNYYSRVFGANYNWTLDELEEYYTRAVNDTREVVRRFPR